VPQVPTRLLNHVLTAARVAGPTDRELLRRYSRSGDQNAFAELVRRHGPMVLGATTRVLGRDPAAEDAFQIAFTALARGARTVRTDSVAGWLHRTAIRAAIRLRDRRGVPTGLRDETPGPTTDPYAEVSWREVRQVVDGELNSLPDHLRVPLVLCYLEALTRDEAAARLGWSLRSLERRLGQGRALLMTRLGRRGVTGLGTVAIATAGGLTLPVPTALAQAVVRSAPRPAIPLSFGYGIAAAALVAVGAAIGLGAQPKSPVADPPAKDSPVPPIAKDAPEVETPDVPLPPGAVRRFGSLAWRHPGGVIDAALSADGKTLVTVGHGTLSVWDVPTGRRTYYSRDLDLFKTIEPGSVAVAPDGSWVAYLGQSKRAVVVFEPATGKERVAIPLSGFALGKPVNRVVFLTIWALADGKTLLVCNDRTLFAYDPATGKELRKFKVPGHVVALSADGNRAMVHDETKPAEAFIYDVPAGKQLVQLDGSFEMPGGNAWFIRASMSADGKRVATLSEIGPEVRLWDTETGKLVTKFKRPQSEKYTGPEDDKRLVSVALAPDGKTVYAGGMVGSGVRRWDVATGKELKPWIQPHGPVSVIIPTRDTAILCEDVGSIHRWDVATGKERPAPTGHHEMARAVRSPDGHTIVTSDFSGRLLVWDAGTGRLTRNIPLEGAVSGPPFAFRPDGKMFACALSVGRVMLFDPATWKPTGEIKIADADQTFIREVKFLADGSGLIIAYGQAQLVRWDLGADRPKWSITEQFLTSAVSPDGKLFVLSIPKGVSIRSVADGSEVRLIPVAADPASNVAFPIRADAIAFSPDGTLVAMTRWDAGDVWVWETATGRETRRLVGHAVPNQTRIGETSVAFSADGRWVATGHADRTARVWELATGKEALRLVGHDATVTGVSFAHDGKTLLTTGGLEVLQWDLRPTTDPTIELESLWTDLGSDDAVKAYRAAANLAARGDSAVTFLRGKLAAVPATDADKLSQMVADLDSSRFATREMAMRTLIDLGPVASPALEAGLEKNPSAEGRTRIEDLLGRLQKPLGGSEARAVRAVQALHWMGGDAAKTVLKEWAAGAPGARLTDGARRSLRTME
jgi:RNA polymerase sigma factor (sigma-70 family)